TAQDMAHALDAALAARKTFGHAVPVRAGSQTHEEVATASGWAVPEGLGMEMGLGPRASGLGADHASAPVPVSDPRPAPLSGPPGGPMPGPGAVPEARRPRPATPPLAPL